MSGENLEVVRRFIDLGRDRDWSQLEMLAEDVVYRPIAEVTETGEYRGRAGYRCDGGKIAAITARWTHAVPGSRGTKRMRSVTHVPPSPSGCRVRSWLTPSSDATRAQTASGGA
jgi:hypothetical protein